jgi:hypothetical protein
MRFALPEGVTEEQVQHAQLQMQIRAAAIFNYRLPLPVSGTLTLAIGEVLDTWDEATLSSAAPPRIATHILRVDREWHPCHGDECGSAIADVTPFVRSWLAGTTANNGLVLHVGGALDEPVMGTVFDIASRESDDPPIIRLTTTGDKPSTALRLWMPLALRYLPRPATAEPSPGPSATPTPKPTPAVGRYLLVERWEDRERGPGCTPLLIDFPTYRFDPVVNRRVQIDTSSSGKIDTRCSDDRVESPFGG